MTDGNCCAICNNEFKTRPQEHVFRAKVDDFEQIIGLDLEGNVLYTRVEYTAHGNIKSSVKV